MGTFPFILFHSQPCRCTIQHGAFLPLFHPLSNVYVAPASVISFFCFLLQVEGLSSNGPAVRSAAYQAITQQVGLLLAELHYHILLRAANEA